jgi:hypothetical protein
LPELRKLRALFRREKRSRVEPAVYRGTHHCRLFLADLLNLFIDSGPVRIFRIGQTRQFHAVNPESGTVQDGFLFTIEPDVLQFLALFRRNSKFLLNVGSQKIGDGISLPNAWSSGHHSEFSLPPHARTGHALRPRAAACLRPHISATRSGLVLSRLFLAE